MIKSGQLALLCIVTDFLNYKTMMAKYSHVRCYWFWLYVKLILNLIDLLNNLLTGIFAMCFDGTMEERQNIKQWYVL